MSDASTEKNIHLRHLGDAWSPEEKAFLEPILNEYAYDEPKPEHAPLVDRLIIVIEQLLALIMQICECVRICKAEKQDNIGKAIHQMMLLQLPYSEQLLERLLFFKGSPDKITLPDTLLGDTLMKNINTLIRIEEESLIILQEGIVYFSSQGRWGLHRRFSELANLKTQHYHFLKQQRPR